jgi:hypothetical protein
MSCYDYFNPIQEDFGLKAIHFVSFANNGIINGTNILILGEKKVFRHISLFPPWND